MAFSLSRSTSALCRGPCMIALLDWQDLLPEQSIDELSSSCGILPACDRNKNFDLRRISSKPLALADLRRSADASLRLRSRSERLVNLHICRRFLSYPRWWARPVRARKKRVCEAVKKKSVILATPCRAPTAHRDRKRNGRPCDLR